MLSPFVADFFGLDESSALTVNVAVPIVVGVPEILEPEMERPAGSVPEETDQVYGEVPPVTARVCEYVWFWTASEGEGVVMERVTVGVPEVLKV